MPTRTWPQCENRGLDNRLFVSKYQLELPKPEELKRYLEEQRRILEGKTA